MKWNVKEVAEARGVKNARALGKLAEIPPMSIYAIWNGEAKRVDLDTLNKLCNVLRVPLALLLEYTPDIVEPLPSGEPAKSAPVERAKSPAHKSSGRQTAGVAAGR